MKPVVIKRPHNPNTDFHQSIFDNKTMWGDAIGRSAKNKTTRFLVFRCNNFDCDFVALVTDMGLIEALEPTP